MKAIPWNGLTISKSGLYSGVSLERYHGDLCDAPSISKSGMWDIASPDGSPAHFFHGSYLNPEAESYEESEALIFGRGAHHLLLGESDFHHSFVIRPEEYPDPDRPGKFKPWNGNATWCKQWLSVETRAGRTILKPDHIRAIRGISKSLSEHPLVQSGILNGLVEHTLVYRDRETGLWVKVRPDVVPTDDLAVSDLKTCVSVSDNAIDRAIGQFGYFLQGGLVRMAFREVFGSEIHSFSLVFVEKSAPYPVRVVTLKDIDLELGEQMATTTLRLIAKCLDKGVWPGPGGLQTDASYVEITPYARRDAEYRMARMAEEVEAL